MATTTDGSVLLIGSFPFKTARQTFEVAGSALAGYARRLPDGEAQGWVRFPGGSLSGARGIHVGTRTGQTQPELPKFGLYERDDPPADELSFAPIGYDKIALRSYEVFREARADGRIAPGTRFQISLPTPFGVIGQFVIPEHVDAVLPAFEQHYLGEVARIFSGIPHQDLALQWDVAVEIVEALSGRRPGLKERAPAGYLADALKRVVDFVPADVEVGLHFCYGNPGGRHVIEPDNTGLMVGLCNDVLARLRRTATWVHMPVPKNRDDWAYFAALQNLRLNGTKLYLGLVHLPGGLAGAKRRIDTAKKAIADFGVAYECGLRTFAEEAIPEMLDLHKQAANYALGRS